MENEGKERARGRGWQGGGEAECLCVYVFVSCQVCVLNGVIARPLFRTEDQGGQRKGVGAGRAGWVGGGK